MALEFLHELNGAQHEAVTYTAGPMLVIAGAGSGKTRVITYKTAYLIHTGFCGPEEIMAVTFTNKAANEMKSRVTSLLGGPLSRLPMIKTFHSLCALFLRGEIRVLGYSSDFTIYDSDDQVSVIKSIIKEIRLPPKELTPELASYRIGQAKIHHVTPDAYHSNYDREHDDLVGNIYKLYEEKLRASSALDFDDLLLKTNMIFESHADIRERFNRRFKYIMIDEFQDTNPPQFVLVRHLTASHKNLCVVGDEDQSIYGFRGAILSNILHFDRDFPGSKIFKLEENYRSTAQILKAASALVSHNTQRRKKTLFTSNSPGEPIEFFEAESPSDESNTVTRAIQKLLISDSKAVMSILYRTNFQSRRFEDALRGASIKYRLVGGLSFYARKEIKDFLAFVRVVLNPADSVSLRRTLHTPPRGIGDRSLAVFESLASQQSTSLWDSFVNNARSPELTARSRTSVEKYVNLILSLRDKAGSEPLGAFTQTVYQSTGYSEFLASSEEPTSESRLSNVQELLTLAAEHDADGGTLQSFMDRMSLFEDAEKDDSPVRVNLMTLHGAKGLEFDHVFIVGVEEGVLPHSRACSNENDVEEERRLLYVGMTRARKTLTISRSQLRFKYNGEAEFTQPSRFLNEIGPEHLQNRGVRQFSAQPRTRVFTPPIKGMSNSKLWPAVNVKNEEDVHKFFSKQPSSAPQIGQNDPKIPIVSQRPPSLAPAQAKITAPSPSETMAVDCEFRQGDRVRHPKFGCGTVVKIARSSLGKKLTVVFDQRGLKSILEHAGGLEKIVPLR